MTLTQASEGGLKISNAGTNGQFLQKQSGDTGGLTWATVSSGTNVGGSNGVDFNDDVYIRLGTGNDLKIWHNAGADSYIRNESGNLRIQANGAGDNAIVIVPDAAVQLMYNNDIRLATTQAGVNIGGNLSSDSGTSFTINAGGASGTAAWFLARCGGENAIAAAPNGEVQLYHDNSKKFETTTNGIQVENSTATAITVVSADDQDGGIYFNDGANQGAVLYQHNGDYMDFRTSGTEKVRIDSSGRVLIGTNSEGNSAADNLTLYDSVNCGITIRSPDDQSGLIYFSDAGSGTGEYAGFIQYTHGTTNTMYLGADSATRMEIRGTGNVKITNGSLLMGTAGTGINFSATSDGTGASNVAEILDDYEEGTFTPTIRANANTNGSADGTASYVKVGKKVTIHVNIGNKTLTGFPQSGPGTIRIDGLPFPVNQQNGDEMSVSSKCIIMGVDNNSNNIYFITQNSQSYLLGYYNADGSVWVASDAGFWDNSGVYCIFTMTYFTNS